MLKIYNNPIDILLQCFEENYPETAKQIKKISFGKLNKGFGFTQFSEDGIEIVLSTKMKMNKPITIEVVTEILAHDLAHALEPDDGHGKKWEAAFDKLHYLYYQKARELKEDKL
jgi:hypothetical protein